MNEFFFSADFIADVLAQPGRHKQTPTAEQKNVIEHTGTDPVLVVAGAGSGKTETIANRVVWLLANGFAKPTEILGLTFTRKAAAELAERVQNRVHVFLMRAKELRENKSLTRNQEELINSLQEHWDDLLERPEVSTYNAFASGIISEFGASIGVSADLSLIDEATAWNLARRVILESNDAGLQNANHKLGTIIERVVQLESDVSDHLADFTDVQKAIASLNTIASLPRSEKELAAGTVGELYADLKSILADVDQTKLFSRLAENYAAAKKANGFIEYSDQIRLALQVLGRSTLALKTLKNRSKYVLLDEVQDTSHAQTRLLSSIYRGQMVMGVGDPHQSIYGWRGASADSLAGFLKAFSAENSAGKAVFLSLSKSFRNPALVLKAANLISRELRKKSRIPVAELRPGANSTPGEIKTSFTETIETEASAVAEWFLNERRKTLKKNGKSPSSAIILRSRKHMQSFADALRSAKIPYEIIGMGGLLATPEVTDIVSTLRILAGAEAGNDLVRILQGPRFAAGLQDLQGLAKFARELSRGASKQTVTTVDALDTLASGARLETAKKYISQDGINLMQQAGAMFRKLRELAKVDLIEVIRAIERFLFIDIELEVKQQGSADARANIFLLLEEVRDFVNATGERDLRTLIAWLDKAAEDNDKIQHLPEPNGDEVQIITVHSAKGLEWDLVAVSRMVETEFPLKARSLRGWLSAGAFPDSCRGDKDSRPVFNFATALTQKDVKESVAKYREDTEKYLLEEETRLAYVAITRSKEKLFLTGSFWSERTGVSKPSPFLSELIEHGLAPEISTTSEFEKNPQHEIKILEQFPADVLGSRRDEVSRSATAVRELIEKHKFDDQNNSQGFFDPYLQALINFEEERKESYGFEILPERINASAFNEMIKNPADAIREFRRPTPKRPYREARVGNIFHEWVQRRNMTAQGSARQLPVFNISDETLLRGESEEIEKLITNFEASRWADYRPRAVELEISFPFAGIRMVSKIDAVYEINEKISIVDWKTGREPKSPNEVEEKMLQLDLYRVAYSHYSGIPINEIDAVLYYVAANKEIRGERFKSLADLEQIWFDAFHLSPQKSD